MKLSRTIVYGIHAVVQLATSKTGTPVPCSQLARDGQLPERFLVQILRCLVNHGVLRSTCGVAGGYSLARPASEITLREIIESFENPLQVQQPAFDCLPEGVRSHLVEGLQIAGDAAWSELQKQTVADLISPNVPTMKANGVHDEATAKFGMAFIRINEFDTSAGSVL
jgi:Rrf2 family protein